MAFALQEPYRAVPAPKIVIAVGACAISGGPYIDHPEVHNGTDSVVPVDLYIPGCPPHPLTILDGLLRLLEEDPRHRDIVLLDRASISERMFAGWAMASARITPELAPVLDALETGVAVSRAVVVMSYGEEERGEPPTTIRRAVEEAFEMAMTHQILRDVELARFRHPQVEIHLLAPTSPLRLRPLEFDPAATARALEQVAVVPRLGVEQLAVDRDGRQRADAQLLRPVDALAAPQVEHVDVRVRPGDREHERDRPLALGTSGREDLDLAAIDARRRLQDGRRLQERAPADHGFVSGGVPHARLERLLAVRSRDLHVDLGDALPALADKRFQMIGRDARAEASHKRHS
jgi:hypothetical protein